MRLGKVTADETAATVGVKCWAANNRVGRKIKSRSVIVAAREGAFNTRLRSGFKGSAVCAVIHDVEAKVHKL